MLIFYKCCCLVCIMFFSIVLYAEETKTERTTVVRETYRKIPTQILELESPVTVHWADVLFDGGTIFLDLQDQRGKKLRVSLKYDRPIRQLSPQSEESLISNYQVNPLTLITNNKREEKQVVIRGPEEAAIYGLLIREHEGRACRSNQNSSDGYRDYWTEVFLQALDQRFTATKQP